jgi:signal transduction histidine kinase
VRARDLTLGIRPTGRLGGTLDGASLNRLRRAMSAHRVTAWIAAAAALYACAVTIAEVQEQAALSPAPCGVAAVSYASFAVVAVLRWPSWIPLAVATASAVAMSAAGGPGTPVGLAVIAGTLVFSARSDRTPAIAGTAAVIGVLLLGSHLAPVHARGGLPDLALPWIAAAAAAGQAVRAQKAQRAMLVERARRAEEGREEEARRRVQQERLRIARELHDAVGHQVALISVQAGAMGCLLDTDPARARESLEHIQQASEAALEELRLTVGLLRQPGDQEPVEPAGGLARLDELIGSFTATGLHVTCHVTGTARPLPEATDLTAYRVIQESLTNTAKHAAGAPAAVRLAFRPGVLALAVEDDGPPPAGDGGYAAGHGIIGMRERAAAVGGWLTAAPRGGGGFRVLAELPAPAPAGAAP